MENNKTTVTISRKSNIKNIATRINIKIQSTIDNVLSELNESYSSLVVNPITDIDSSTHEAWVEAKVLSISKSLNNEFNQQYSNHNKNVTQLKDIFEKYLGLNSIKSFEVYSKEDCLNIIFILKTDKIFQDPNKNTFLSFKEEIKPSNSISSKYIIKEQGLFSIGSKVFKFSVKNLLTLYKTSYGKDILTKVLLKEGYNHYEIESLLTFFQLECFVTLFDNSSFNFPIKEYYHKYIKTEFLSNLSDRYSGVKTEYKYFTLIPDEERVFIFFTNDPKIFNNILTN